MDTLEKMVKPKSFIKSGPHLSVKNLRLTLNYYRDILGFLTEWIFGNKDGGLHKLPTPKSYR